MIATINTLSNKLHQQHRSPPTSANLDHAVVLNVDTATAQIEVGNFAAVETAQGGQDLAAPAIPDAAGERLAVLADFSQVLLQCTGGHQLRDVNHLTSPSATHKKTEGLIWCAMAE